MWKPHRKKGIRNYLKDCPDWATEETYRILKERADEKLKTGPARCTRSQAPGDLTTGRLEKQTNMTASPSFPFLVTDGRSSLNGSGPSDDGRDELIASGALAEAAVVKVICGMEAIYPVSIQVALASTSKSNKDA